MSRSYHGTNLHSDDDDHPKKESELIRKMKAGAIDKRAQQREGQQYIDQRRIETNISFQVAGIIAKSLQVTYDDSIKTRFIIEKIIEDGSVLFSKLFPKNPPLLLEYTKKTLSRDEIRKEIEIALAWIMKESREEEKKLYSTEICYTHPNT